MEAVKMMDMEGIVQGILSLPGSETVQFIILYGSRSISSERPDSDIDICIHHTGTEEERADYRFRVLSELMDDKIDIHTYLDLPLYIRKDIFKGDLLFCRNLTEISDLAYTEIREYQDFAPRYLDYIGAEALG